MDKNFGRLPPLNALRGFEAAARLGSFSRAAEEQNMTQSAISHQVKSLEEFFGQPLFSRVGRSVELTDAGGDFLETARRTLEHLARGTRRMDAYLKPGQVVVATSPAFAGKWLIPRYEQMRRDIPLIEPWIYATNEQADSEYAELEIGIWRGHGDWPGLKTVKLFDDWITPLCAPGLLQGAGPNGAPADLSGLPLLHDEVREDWHDWFRLSGVERQDASAGYNFSDSGLLLDCAVAGHGAALGSLALADHHLEDGSLIRLFPTALKTEEAYYAVCVEEYLRRAEVRILWDWLIGQAETFRVHAYAGLSPLGEHGGSG
ncbi:MAG: transcriptional regulator GcvA [Pseudomonadota bacterium]